MFELRKSLRAEDDLIDIWLYTVQEWGVAQADNYLDEIEAGFQQLLSTPNLGRSRDDIREGYFSIPLNHHIAFYTFEANTIKVQRVLHEKMDVERQFKVSSKI